MCVCTESVPLRFSNKQVIIAVVPQDAILFYIPQIVQALRYDKVSEPHYYGVASTVTGYINPIELLWKLLDRMLGNKCPSSQSNLWEVLQEAWGEISLDYLNILTTKMTKVCKTQIAANGGFFIYSHLFI